MSPSVSPEADWELTREAIYYAREGGAELGLAFIAEFERAVALLCTHPDIGGALEKQETPLPSPGVSFQRHLVTP